MRRLAVLLIAAVLVAGGAVFILAGGNALRSKPDTSGGAAGGAGVKEATAEATASPGQMSTERPAPKGAAGRHAARSLAPFTQDTTNPAIGDDDLEIAAPRAPLSDIGQALPRKPEEEPLLFRPVATAAGILEVKGYRIAIAGVEPVAADETCDFQGQSWPCGMRARAAFRAWLRGRSISCELPPQAVSDTVVTSCRVGKQDVAAWLVDSGWARAVNTGPYVESGNAAAKAGKGIFGAPPVMKAPALKSTESALPAPPASDGGILAAPIAEPEFEPVVPTRPSGPLGAFPPAPAPPPAPAQ